MKSLLLLLAVFVLSCPAWAAESVAKGPILIGGISEAKLFKVYANNQNRGFEHEGSNGTLEEVLHDVEELVNRQGVKMLIGTGPDHVELWVGKVGLKNDKLTLVNWTYEPSDKFYLGDDYVKTVRPQK